MKTLVDNPKEPFPLYRKKGENYEIMVTIAGGEIWACGECGHLYGHQTGDNSPHDMAAKCCKQKYCTCGEKLREYWMSCDKCQNNKQEVKRQSSAAEIEGYDGPVYNPASEDYHSDIEQFIDWAECEQADGNGDSIPEWIYACTIRGFGSLDADSVIESELCEHHEDAADNVVDIEELQEALDKWVAKQTIQSWEVDYSRKISVKKLLAAVDCTA